MFKIPDFTTATEKYNQNLDFSSIITDALRTPGVKINRESFLKKELLKYYHENTIKEAITGFSEPSLPGMC